MATQTTTPQTDPVCGMQVAPGKAAGTSEHGGKTFYFCSPGCKAKFDKNPEQFARGNRPSQSGGGCCG